MTTTGLIGLCLLGSFFLLIAFNVPICACLGVSSLLTMLIFRLPVSSFVSILYTGMAKYSLLAAPFFILAGLIMEKSGTSRRIIEFANCLVGPIPGGLAIISVVLTVFWGAVSGNGPATVFALGTVLIPAMIDAGYKPAFAAALIAASSALSVVIPPSTCLIIYGVVSGSSISDLYIGGVLPGLMVGAMFIVYVYFVSKKRGYKGGRFGTRHEIWVTFKRSIWGLMAPVIILGGIYAGLVTPTESAVIGSIYAFVVGAFIYKGFDIKDMWGIFKSTASSSASLMVIVGCASVFSWLITSQGIAQAASTAILSLSDNKYIVGLLVAVILLIAGCLLDGVSITYLLYPILWPVVSALGYSSLWFGVFLAMAIAVGMATPPVALNIYPACGIAKIKMEEITPEILRFVLVAFIGMLLTLVFPEIITVLPDLLAK